MRPSSIIQCILFLGIFFFHSLESLSKTQESAIRLKNLVNVKGVRENILIGHGIVVGLRGTGDSSGDVTGQSLARLFSGLGVDLQNNATIKSKNTASVIVTTKLPPFARVGNLLDVTVSADGDAGSLEGGTLLVTPLYAGGPDVYAVAQGTVSIGSTTDGNAKNFPTVGRVLSGATIEKDIEQSLEKSFSEKQKIQLALHQADFTTAARIETTINAELGGRFASARDSGTIDVVIPMTYAGKSVELLALLENLSVHVATKERIILNERTGTVIMGDKIHIEPVAISHGDLSIEIRDAPKGAKPIHVAEFKPGASVSDLVKMLNTLGVQSKDLTAIFQALKKMGALQAELEIM